MNNVFNLVKAANIDIKDYIVANYPQLVWEKDKCTCPFHNDAKASLSYNKKENFVHCFACGTGGDIITFTEKLHKVAPVEAAKIILRNSNIIFEDFEYKALSDEDRKAYDDAQEKRVQELEKRKATIEAETKAAKDKAISVMTPKAKELSDNLVSNFGLAVDHLKIFNNTEKFSQYREQYVGYDLDEESICILNRDENGTTKNIKYRTKKGFEGKWIGWKNSTVSPFPLDYYNNHAGDKVVICEGEKDALNLLSLSVKCLTLGGVTASWEQHKELLKDKIIYIMFDNDAAGYENAIKRYNELKTISSTVYITLFFHINRALPKKYDISDFIFENKIKNNSEFFHMITYSSYSLTNELIDDISEYLSMDFSSYKTIAKVLNWKDVKRKFLLKDTDGNAINIPIVKGELDDEEVDNFLERFKNVKKTKQFMHFRDVVAKSMDCELDEVIENFSKFMEVKQTLLTNYRQTHIVDMVKAFLQMGKTTGHTFAKYHDKFCIWTGTHYQVLENDKHISDFIHQQWMYYAKIDFKKQTKKNVDELIDNVKSKSATLENIKEDQDKRVLVFDNGTLYISQKGAITFKNSHDKKDAATNVLNFSYDEGKKAPKWEKFLDRVLPDIKDQHLLMEYIGYCFLPSHAYESFLFLYGKSGSNGKSVILEIVRNFFGNENVSSLQLQQFEGHQLEALQNKMINIGTEIDAKGLDKGQFSTLKALVSPKDQIQVNPKNKQPYSLNSKDKPKLLFSGNDKPKAGIDDAVFRRMLLLGFDTEIKDGEKIRNLEDRFTDELSGILNMALEGLLRLIKNGKFSKSDKMLAEVEEYKDEVNPIRKYLSENVSKVPDSMVPKRFIYSHYREWINEKGGRALSEQTFWTKMKAELKDIDTVGKQMRVRVDFMDIEQPRFVRGIFMRKDEIYSFPFNNKEVKSENINFDYHTKAILVMEDN